MNKPQISRLTQDELAQARPVQVAETPAAYVSAAPIDARTSINSTEYIKKLSIDEIEKFFEQFDGTSCAKIPNEKDPKFVFVTCNGFSVTFSDYSFLFDFNETLLLPEHAKPKFNLEAFADYCSKIEKNPDQVISELMTIKLFGQRFPSYSEHRKNAKLKESRRAFEQLPAPMQKTLAITNEQKQHEINSTHDKLYYGVYDASQFKSEQ